MLDFLFPDAALALVTSQPATLCFVAEQTDAGGGVAVKRVAAFVVHDELSSCCVVLRGPVVVAAVEIAAADLLQCLRVDPRWIAVGCFGGWCCWYGQHMKFLALLQMPLRIETAELLLHEWHQSQDAEKPHVVAVALA